MTMKKRAGRGFWRELQTELEKQGHKSSLCLQYVSRVGAFPEIRIGIGYCRVLDLLHRK